MAQQDIIVPVEATEALPVVRQISISGLKDVVAKGIADFWAMPTHVVFLCLIYPAIGLLLARAIFGMELIPLLYPIASGFALVGPFAAIGLYELSRRREQGLDTSWRHAFDVVHSPSFPSIVAVGVLLMLIFAVWVATAHSIFISEFGYREPYSLIAFANAVLTTPEGHRLILIGNAVGFLFAVLAFSLSAISIPLLLDRNVGAAVAIATSVKVVLTNPVTMAVWGLFVAASLLVGSLPLLLGLPFVLPILGHATWHLYRTAVEPDNSPRPQFEPHEKAPRYAAEFPSSLFFPHREHRR
jgi:uncharacterized membrane protein